VKKPTTPLGALIKKRKMVEKQLDRYERMMALYFTKVKKARLKVRYYDRAIEKESGRLQYTPSVPMRIVEL